MKHVLLFLILWSTNYLKAQNSDTKKNEFDIIKYLQGKYPPKYSDNNVASIENSDVCNCTIAYLKGAKYFYRQVFNSIDSVVGYNILGAFIIEGNGHDGIYGNYIKDPHFISKTDGKIIQDFFILDFNIGYTVKSKPSVNWVSYGMYNSQKYPAEYNDTVIVCKSFNNSDQDSVLFKIDNTSREQIHEIFKVELLNPSINLLNKTSYNFVFHTNRGMGIINSKGEFIFDDIFHETIYLKTKNSVDYFQVTNNLDADGNTRKFGIAKSNGSYVFEPNFDELETGGYNLDTYGVGLIQYKGKYGLIDKDYNMIVEPKYDELSLLEGSKQLAIIKESGYDCYNNRRYKYDFLNYNTKKVLGLNLDEIDINSSILGSEIAIKKDGKWGFCNKNGQIIVPPKYSLVTPFNENIAFVSTQVYNKVYDNRGRVYLFDRSKFLQNVNYFINKSGAIIATINKNLGDDIDEIGTFSDGMLAFKSRKTGLYGFINKKGELAISPTFETVESFFNGQCNVRKYGTGYIIDKKGNFINNN